MKGYSYNPINFAYEGAVELQLDPVKTKNNGEECYLLPTFCSTEKPSESIAEGQHPVFNKETESWDIKDDHEGKTVYALTEEGFIESTSVITDLSNIRFEIGTHIILEPNPSLKKPKWTGTEWIEGEQVKDIAELKQEKIAEIKKKAYETITTAYPEWKQINIISNLQGYTEQEKTAMGNFILNIREQCSLFESDVTTKTAREDVEQYIFEYSI